MTRYQNSTKCWSGRNRVRVWKSQPEQCGRASSILSPLQLMTPNSYGFIAQLVEHCTGIAEVTGSNPAEA